jgi:hypothetical protein
MRVFSVVWVRLDDLGQAMSATEVTELDQRAADPG